MRRFLKVGISHVRAGRSRTVGMAVLDVANPFFTSGVEQVADELGSVVTVCNSAESPERENRHLEVLLEQRVAGLLITPVDVGNPRLQRFVEQQIPVVLVDRGYGLHRLCSVTVDDRLGGQMAVRHLCEQGHERIAFVGGPDSIPQVADRQRGAREALAEAGVGEDSLLVIETPFLRLPDGQVAGEKLATMAPGERPTAVFCANDLLALGVLQEMRLHGLSVPDDVAIVGYDDIQYAAGAAVPLSSVRQPREALARAAARLLFEEIATPQRHEHRQVPFQPELIVRDSSATVPTVPDRRPPAESKGTPCASPCS